MLIKIDCRETKLFQLCTALGDETKPVTLVSASLPLGDVIICDDAGNEKVIIERKSLNDLASSIRDGRYTEQGYRLNQCEIHNHHIYYLVEGDLRYYRPFKGMPDKKSLLSAMVSISFFKGFSLYRTNSLEETAEWVLHFATKLQKEGPSALPFYRNKTITPTKEDSSIANENEVGTANQANEVSAANQANEVSAANQANEVSAANQANEVSAISAANDVETNSTGTSYTEAMAKRTKKENITPENIGEIMLSQIPNVSTASAMAIMRKFRTMFNLIEAIRRDAAALNDITVSNKNGQDKKLTKPCINNIYQYLINPTVITVDT
jgi:ERCC4-type nuclease